GRRTMNLDADIAERCWRFSGEGRFRWLHAHEGRQDELLGMCRERYGELAWVLSRQEISDAGWFCGPIDERVASRLGCVALVASAPVSFNDPTYNGDPDLQTRHGSLTSAEMYVPLLAKRV